VNLDVNSLIRDENERKTPIGIEFLSMVQSGKIIPAETIVRMLRKIIYSGDGRKKFILTSFPDIIDQAKEFERSCAMISAIIYTTNDVSSENISIPAMNIPTVIFSSSLGVLEAVVKYMKENLKMAYSEIADSLLRDDRTIWISYDRAKNKMKEEFVITESKVSIPISAIANDKLTILESAILYLRKEGYRYSKIGELLNRDQRNIWAIYRRAKSKLENNIKFI
jgi:DNA-binding CsgD family transcriptional regulator